MKAQNSFSPNFSFRDGYEQFAKFFACQIFPLYGVIYLTSLVKRTWQLLLVT